MTQKAEKANKVKVGSDAEKRNNDPESQKEIRVNKQKSMWAKNNDLESQKRQIRSKRERGEKETVT